VKEVAGKLNLESLVRRPQPAATSQPSSPAPEAAAVTPTDSDFTALAETETQPAIKAGTFIGPMPNPDVILTGNLTEKVRSQGWSKHHEYRILVSLERDPVSGLPVADRYYCCSIYVDEAQAAKLQPGKPVRIKIEQD